MIIEKCLLTGEFSVMLEGRSQNVNSEWQSGSEFIFAKMLIRNDLSVGKKNLKRKCRISLTFLKGLSGDGH